MEILDEWMDVLQVQQTKNSISQRVKNWKTETQSMVPPHFQTHKSRMPLFGSAKVKPFKKQEDEKVMLKQSVNKSLDLYNREHARTTSSTPDVLKSSSRGELVSIKYVHKNLRLSIFLMKM